LILVHIYFIHIHVLFSQHSYWRITISKEVIKSAERVFAVLELFRNQQSALTATEICKHLKYPKSSADALLKSLVTLGYLTMDPSTVRYFPSLRVTKLGDWLPDMLLGGGYTLSMLNELHSLTGETVTLSMPNELSMQFITAIPGTFPMSLTINEGLTVPIFATAVGIAHLATRSDPEIHKLVKQSNRQAVLSEHRVDVDELSAEIETARANGYALAYDRILTDTGAIAMALPVNQLDRALVVAIGGLSSRIKTHQTQIIQKMRQAIRQLG
jgi:DNA-binding IclR family transcriptional regulator